MSPKKYSPVFASHQITSVFVYVFHQWYPLDCFQFVVDLFPVCR
jgi:hypothetical protein